MDEINYILNDQSKNDKDLIKELSVCINNHKNKKLPINKKFVKDIIDITLRNSEINFNEIVFTDDCDYAMWTSDKEFVFNIAGVLKNAEFVKDSTNIGDNSIFIYYTIIMFVIHEVTHARQDYINKTERNEIYNSCDEFIDNNYDMYYKNHDIVLIERYANLRGNVIAYEVLSYVYPQEKLKEFRKIIYEYLFCGYEVDYDGEITIDSVDRILHENGKLISALDSYNELMNENLLPMINIEANDDMTLYERLYLGLPITNEEYTKLLSLYLHIDEKSGSVKKLINKL